MKFVRLLTSPIPCSERRQKLLGILAVFVMLLSGGTISVLTYECPAAIVIPASAVLGFLLIRFRLHLLMFRLPLATHSIAIYAGYLSLRFLKLNETLMGNFVDLLLSLTFLFSFFFYALLTELLLGILLRLFGTEPHPELFPRLCIVSGSLLFTISLFLTADSFFGNSDELIYIFLTFAPYYLLVTLLGAPALAALLCLFREKHLHRFTCTLIGLLLCMYCQYMFMNSMLPRLDYVGQVEWDTKTGECIVNLLIWIVLFALPFILFYTMRKKKPSLAKLPVLLSGAIGAVQLLTLIVLMCTSDKVFTGYATESLNADDQFVVSQHDNVIVFVLDMADQDLFEEAYAADPAPFACLKDFTYYTNTAMPYDSTYHSIIAMLTDAQTYPQTDIYEWYQEICNAVPSQTFFQRLHDNQYTVNLYGQFMPKDYTVLQGYADNLAAQIDDNIEIDRFFLYNCLDTMTAYRVMPLFLKRFFQPDVSLGNDAIHYPHSCIHRNTDFLEYTDLRTSETDNNYFIMQHLKALHTGVVPPEHIPICLEILNKYFKQMQELGVYDDALIIVTADHGIHNQPENMPIWYMKKPHETGTEIRYNSAPITLTDLPATVLDEMGMFRPEDADVLGRPISQIAEDEARERLVFQRRYFCDPSLVPFQRYDPEEFFGSFFGYYYTGTKKDLGKRELAEGPDILLETDEY